MVHNLAQPGEVFLEYQHELQKVWLQSSLGLEIHLLSVGTWFTLHAPFNDNYVHKGAKFTQEVSRKHSNAYAQKDLLSGTKFEPVVYLKSWQLTLKSRTAW